MKYEDIKVGMRVTLELGGELIEGEIKDYVESFDSFVFLSDKENRLLHDADGKYSYENRCWYITEDYCSKVEIAKDEKEISLLDAIVLMREDDSRVFKANDGYYYKIIDNKLFNSHSTVCDFLYTTVTVSETITMKATEVKVPFKDRVKLGDRFYFVTECFEVDWFCYHDVFLHNQLIQCGNFFETEEEAQQKAKELLEILNK